VPPLEEIGLLRSWAYNLDEVKRAHGAMWAFEILGPKAAPAIPALARLAASHTNFTVHAAVSALGAIGPAAQPALVEFITTKRQSPFRSEAIRSLDFGEGAVTNIPMLIECLDDSQATTVRAAVFALGRIKAHSELVVPALINCFKHIQPNQPAAKLSDDQLALQLEIVSAFGELGQEAHVAVPSLLAALREKNEDDGAACRLIKTLGLIAKKPEPVVPFLVAYLDHTNSWLAHCSVGALAKLGPLATKALPALTNALQHQGGDKWIEYAIQEITAPKHTNAPAH
jgi:hypothetical protein